jgi:NADH:ubiquinone oxidoreductase subunit
VLNILKKLRRSFNYYKVGADIYGNKYYQSKKVDQNLGICRRVVEYNGIAEPSKIPQVWHAWLYYILKDVPTDDELMPYSWQKEHEANFTGTEEAYFPSRYALHSVKHSDSSRYISWKPRS